jgi:DNA helicase-2/ATP-dependent DNA helicase PcrA
VRRPSRFLEELPQDEVKFIDRTRKASAWDSGGFGDAYSQTPTKAWDDFSQDHDWNASSRPEATKSKILSFPTPNDSYQVGRRLQHPDYGVGMIVQREGSGEALKVSIKFAHAGVKKFVVKYAPLEFIS